MLRNTAMKKKKNLTENKYGKFIFSLFASSKTPKNNLRSQNIFNKIFSSVIKFDLQIITTFCHANTQWSDDKVHKACRILHLD